MGTKRQMNQTQRHAAPVDVTSMPECEATTASHAAAGLLARGCALLRYPLFVRPVRGIPARAPVRR
jgi:hypothetical protein